MPDPSTFLIYDLETSGTDLRWDRIIQFACLRTDAQFNEIESPASFYVRLPIDVLPSPEATVVTGLTPQIVNASGMPELEAYVEMRRHLSRPGTCAMGYNSLRFDDEFIRHGFFRHFIDPYAREWQAGNSRWDLIDLVRAAGALRPEGMQWPTEDGLPSFRLEALTAANAIEHAGAHDALVDVRATLALARLVRKAQPKLFEYYLGMRQKKSAMALLSAARPSLSLHVSGMFGRERHCIAPVMPIAVHPTNSNSVIVADLGRDVRSLLAMSADQIRETLFVKGVEDRPPLKEIRVNRCPFVAPPSVLRSADAARLGLDLDLAQQRFDQLHANASIRDKVRAVYSQRSHSRTNDADSSLYDGFVNDADRSRCAQVLQCFLDGDPVDAMDFEDDRLHELLWRLRARRAPAALSERDRANWRAEVGRRLLDTDSEGRTLAQFRASVSALPQTADSVKIALQSHANVVEAFVTDR